MLSHGYFKKKDCLVICGHLVGAAKAVPPNGFLQFSQWLLEISQSKIFLTHLVILYACNSLYNYANYNCSALSIVSFRRELKTCLFLKSFPVV